MAQIQARSLLKELLCQASKYTDYNFRAHALRRAAYMYEKQIEGCDEVTLNKHIKNMEKDIQVIKRQVLIGELYAAEKHILEQT